MTLIELIVALAVFGLIMTGALGFMAVQNTAFRTGLDRTIALQAVRFSMQLVETDFATLGTNLAAGQPGLVLAGEDVIAFNANHTTNVSGDPFAAFYDPDAPNGQVSVLSSEITIPRTAVTYPDTTYGTGGAELLIFFFEPDTSTARGDDYVFYRKVNDGAPELIARNLLEPEDEPFFRYLRYSGSTVDSIPDGSLPIYHQASVHLSAADTASAAALDSVRAVRVTLRGTNGETGDRERTAELSRIIRFPNAGLARSTSCGGTPILGVTPTATLVTDPSGEHSIGLSWSQATDESGGEGDIIRYVIWRRDSGASGWGDPYLSIPAGQTSYVYSDAAVEPGETYRYALAAQDCTPNLSPMAATLPVAIP